MAPAERLLVVLCVLILAFATGWGSQDSPSSSKSPFDAGGSVETTTTESASPVKARASQSNVSGQVLVVTDVTVESLDFSIIEDECSGRELQANESCVLVIRFSPRAKGLRSTLLRIKVSPDKPFGPATLEGSGGRPSLPKPSIPAPPTVFDPDDSIRGSE